MKVVIVGGVAGGASAAARMRRLDEKAEIVVFERGEHVSFANCGLPYHIGGVIPEREMLLLHTPEALRARFALDVRIRHEVVGIRRSEKKVTVKNLETGVVFDEPYDALILSPGAKPIVPKLPGVQHERVYTLRNIADTDRIRAALAAGAKRAVVVGGGYIGVEMAENLVARGLAVTLIEMAPQVLTFLDPEMAALAHDEMRAHGVELLLGERVVGFEPAASSRREARVNVEPAASSRREARVNVEPAASSRREARVNVEAAPLSVTVASGRTLSADLVILAIGVMPEVGLAREAGLTIGPSGGIAVDAQMRTSDPAIFAVGDAVEVTHFVAKSRVRIPLAGPANRQARIAANTIANIPSSYKETQGTSIIQVFDLVCAATGASQSVLQAANIPFQTVRVHGGSHAGYYPGASTLHLTVLFSPEDGRLLGAQACGKDGVDKRIDVLATGLRHGATVYDLEDYELAYAPPFGSAKDPINMAGFVAVNALRGTAPLVDPAEIDGAIKRGAVLLDVRNASERAAGKIEPSIHIPVNDLRARIDEVPKDKPIVAYCAVGLRGHIALRILKQQGFDARNLSGGFASYQLAKGRTQPRT